MNLRGMRWAGRVPRRDRGELYAGFWWGNLGERDHLEDPGIDGRTILSWILGKWFGGCRLDRSGRELGQVVGCCGGGDEP